MGLPRVRQKIRVAGDAARTLFRAAKKSFRAARANAFDAPVFHLLAPAPREHRASRIHAARGLRRLFTAALLFVAILSSCGGRRAPAPVPAARIGATEEGIASWYGEPYHGRRAANGEVYDMDRMTAAHPSLPFETWVRVRSLVNNKNAEVRIIDRGPFAKGRVIDLSRAAARQLDLIRNGTAKVRITVIAPPAAYVRGRQFTVQVSSVPVKSRAESLQRQLAPRFREVTVRYRTANPQGGHAEAWRVLVGREDSPASAQRLLERLQPKFPNAFVVPWDAE